MPSELLSTERLSLREFGSADLPHLVTLDTDPRVWRFLGEGKPPPPEVIAAETLPDILAGYRDGFGTWAGFAGDRFVGWFSLRPTGREPGEAELGYRLRSAFWGNGYATEGAAAVVRYGFETLGVQRIVAFTMTVNTGSRRVMEKCGLTYVRTFFEDWPGEPIEGGELGDVEYAAYSSAAQSDSSGSSGRTAT